VAKNIAEIVLDAEAKIGELLKQVSKVSGGDRRSDAFKKGSTAPFESEKQQARETLPWSSRRRPRHGKRVRSSRDRRYWRRRKQPTGNGESKKGQIAVPEISGGGKFGV